MVGSATSRLGIELLSFHGLLPLEQVAVAAQLGCSWFSCGLTQLPAAFNPRGVADWSLRDDAALRRDLIAAMHDTGVAISLGEGFSVRPGGSLAQRAVDVDLMAQLGARGLGGVCMEADQSRAINEFTILATLCAERGMLATIEFGPGLPVATLAEAVALVRAVDLPNFRLLIDSMHFFRSGGTVDQLIALDPALIGYAQLCDVPITPALPSYMDEAMTARLNPGEGDLPLAAFVAAMPPDVPVSLEIPNLARLAAEPDPFVRLKPAVRAAQDLLKQGE